MNPSSAGIWCNPPPPGTDEDLSNSSVKKDSPERAIDRIDPFLKSSEYIKYERKLEHRRRSRSRSRHRRHRSRSRGRHRHRRRRHSSSRSRSRSRSRRRHKRSRHSRSHSRTRSRSRSHRRRRRSRSRKRSHSHSHQKPEPPVEDKTKVEEDVEDEEEEASNENMFKNDGSFMEMFKKMQEEQKKKEAESAAESRAPQPAFGKRRGGKVLKTGMVQKTKSMNQEEGDAQDAWTLYMKEVKRYKEACCDDDSKTRLLVK
ncbi:hypothetical protein Zmor_008238 [Zophobas morio]|uniref:Arginine/serine-rich coiled-coil protein 2 n=1 Tax=Zophobas morio TaxID=2755281 RepID=A0AA38J209_9CUCU|nr:hypothetical protein Zmor_008238 [Zophobas morio]